MKCGQVLEQRAAVPKAEKQRGGTERAGAQAAEQTPGPHFRTCGSTAISGPPSLCEFLRAGGGQRPSCPSLWRGEETACRGSSLAGQHSPHPTALLPLQHMVSHPLCSYEGSETNPILHMEKLGQEGRPSSRWQRLATSYTPGQGENWARFGAREEMGDSGPLLSQGRHKARSPHRTA